MRAWLFNAGSHSKLASFGLLVFRVAAGGIMAAAHGWGKLASFGEGAATFPDPLGIGRTASLAGTVGAEFFCALLVMFGLGTRWAALPLAFTMGVAAFMVHAGDPFRKKELAIVYLVGFLLLAFTGAGAYSLDAKLGGKKRR
jgi:putative oxidoreductase